MTRHPPAGDLPSSDPTPVERRLLEALGPGQPRSTSPDLFDRVLGSIADDRIRRRRNRRGVLAAVAGLLLLTAIVLLLTPTKNGHLLMDWWVLELITTGLLIGLALWLGPFIKRFGRAYAADVFHDNPQTGKSYIVLTDIVYYLIFTAYILFTVSFEPRPFWGLSVLPRQVSFEAARLGGILLIIGVLHGLNIVLMPVLGRLFSLNRKLSGH
ncbi:hypothetical protein EV644_103180 [Kribbella orskensis]|uniref:TRAP-type C4-dicarboxylate transport system permease small subunit n=1 Tax=Kribbella orskensis TaxID=2512216 RepID=A0ABY2BPC1_9ACTN|nr:MULTISPECIES: hypothetical protein [Kribbella]TCN39736.1 hypothetical protein EV642_106240 [Kribbella sp. VKM Ac-2500]TCO27481.1 hypothetical protein EV644_103180 [Kribbella orskensis]